ncbi:MAG: S46 family peptidase [Pirellulales bacterium]|nr:S46 family peptidase [Pirellulales bacterium]
MMSAVSGDRFVSADEGMWLFNNPPRKLLREMYQFEPDAGWYEHLQKASVRFNSGGSGSFVAPTGLVMTNHHVGADALAKLSTAEHDYLAEGFQARSRDEEIKCHDLELNVLMSIEDVTARVNAAVDPGLNPSDAQQARRAVMSEIEKESLDKTGLRSDVVTLYQGGLYHLYRFKKYTDVRLVFAPEKAIAFFGGDPDNFEFPRYDLDICFFRAYEDGQPAKPEHFLKWSASGAKDGELVFVSGHPGRTDRQNTVDHLEFLRDRALPSSLNLIRRREVLLATYSDRSQENARQAEDELFGYQNSRKARLGQMAGLQDPALFKSLSDREMALRAAVADDAKLQQQAGTAWGEVAAALAAWSAFYDDYAQLEQAQAFNSELFSIARTLIRLSAETAKPNGDRLREFRESNLESLKQQLFSTAPIYPALETAKLADSLGMLIEKLGARHDLVKHVLAGKSPQARAAELIQGSKLADVALRKRLAEEGASAQAASGDPLIELARLVDEPSRAVRKRYEDTVEEPLRQAYAKIANARFAQYGTEIYPDATFTLRLAFGTVRGYEQEGQKVAAWTTLGGTYPHAAAHGNVYPFALPKRWIEGKDKLALDTPFNFVSTADIIGGNSGSPVVNRSGEVVGIIFDGNIQSLVLAYAYTDTQARAVSVASPAIIESLKKLYGAEALVAEMGR